jgi:hypothetical protein
MAQGSLLNFSCLVSGILAVGQKAHNGLPAFLCAQASARGIYSRGTQCHAR